MTQVFLDPAGLEAVAALLRRVQGEVADLAGNVAASGGCEVPPSMSYVDGELGAIGSTVGIAADGYGSAADDVATRAGMVADDTSLTGAMTAVYGAPGAISAASGDSSLVGVASPTAPDVTVALIGGGAGASILPEGVSSTPVVTVSTIGGPQDAIFSPYTMGSPLPAYTAVAPGMRIAIIGSGGFVPSAVRFAAPASPLWGQDAANMRILTHTAGNSAPGTTGSLFDAGSHGSIF